MFNWPLIIILSVERQSQIQSPQQWSIIQSGIRKHKITDDKKEIDLYVEMWEQENRFYYNKTVISTKWHPAFWRYCFCYVWRPFKAAISPAYHWIDDLSRSAMRETFTLPEHSRQLICHWFSVWTRDVLTNEKEDVLFKTDTVPPSITDIQG